MAINVEQRSANPSVGALLKIRNALAVGLPAWSSPPAPKALKVVLVGF